MDWMHDAYEKKAGHWILAPHSFSCPAFYMQINNKAVTEGQPFFVAKKMKHSLDIIHGDYDDCMIKPHIMSNFLYE